MRIMRPDLYPRKPTIAGRRAYQTALALDRAGDWRVTWANGQRMQAFKTEESAWGMAYRLRVVRGVTDATVTGPHPHTIEVQP